MTEARRIAWRAVKIVIFVELAYLVIVNGALQLSLTQDLINKIRPEKFYVSWDSAWSFYPFRINARGVGANGQSRSQQWELKAAAVSGSIAVLPLILKQVNVSSVRAQDIDYLQRPRLKPDRDYSTMLDHFPQITGREIVSVDVLPLKKKRPWKVRLTDTRAIGQHSFWIFNMKGSGTGSAVVDMSMETRGGPFALEIGELDLALEPVYINSRAELFHGGELQGEFGFSPFVRRDNKGRRMLPFVYLDTTLDLAVGSLDFINLFTAGLGDLDISGAGRVRGRVVISDSSVRSGTDFTASADELGVAVREMNVSGRGTVAIHTPADADMPLGIDISYDSVMVTHPEQVEPFLRGDSLNLQYRGSNVFAPDPDKNFKELLKDEQARARHQASTFSLLVKDALLVDMSVFNYYLPPQAPFNFGGGSASLDADIALGLTDMEGYIELDSTDVLMRWDDQTFEGNLAASINIAGGVPEELRADISGSVIVLDEVSVAGKKQSFEDDYWSTSLEFTDAEGVFQKPIELAAKAELKVSDTRPLVAMFDNKSGAPRWLSKLMLVKDLDGKATLDFAKGRLNIPLAYVDSEVAEVAAKGSFHQGDRDGLVYARYKKLDVLLKRFDGKRDIDMINVRKKFDEYALPEPD